MGVIKFQKNGVVKVGTGNPDQPEQHVNLVNPIGSPLDITVNMETMECKMSVHAVDQDGRNSVVREYPIALDQQAFIDFVMSFFVPHVRRIARDSYDEFKDLIELNPDGSPKIVE